MTRVARVLAVCVLALALTACKRDAGVSVPMDKADTVTDVPKAGTYTWAYQHDGCEASTMTLQGSAVKGGAARLWLNITDKEDAPTTGTIDLVAGKVSWHATLKVVARDSSTCHQEVDLNMAPESS